MGKEIKSKTACCNRGAEDECFCDGCRQKIETRNGWTTLASRPPGTCGSNLHFQPLLSDVLLANWDGV